MFAPGVSPRRHAVKRIGLMKMQPEKMQKVPKIYCGVSATSFGSRAKTIKNPA
jgi:hypothetical protein